MNLRTARYYIPDSQNLINVFHKAQSQNVFSSSFPLFWETISIRLMKMNILEDFCPT